jgi:hypothetical protein
MIVWLAEGALLSAIVDEVDMGFSCLLKSLSVVSQMLPVLGREVVEGNQRVAILDQALDSLVVFDAPGFDEGVERGECILLGLGHPDLLERTLGLRLLALGQLVQDIGLYRSWGKNVASRA